MHRTRPLFADVDRVFDEMTRGLAGAPAATGFGALDASVDPETGVLTAVVDLPGADRDALSVQVVGDALVVEARRQRPETAGRVVAAERPTGRTRRVLRTRRALDADTVTASYDDGVLVVRAETRAPGRTVEVSFGGGSQLAAAPAEVTAEVTTDGAGGTDPGQGPATA